MQSRVIVTAQRKHAPAQNRRHDIDAVESLARRLPHEDRARGAVGRMRGLMLEREQDHALARLGILQA